MSALSLLDDALRRTGLIRNPAAQVTAEVNAPVTEVVRAQDQDYSSIVNLKVPRYTTVRYHLKNFKNEKAINKSFPDDTLFQEKAIDLIRLSDEDIIEIGSRTFTHLKSNYCLQDAGALLLLAFNLRGEDRASYVCVDEIPDECVSIDDIGYNLLDDIPIFSNVEIGPLLSYKTTEGREIANAYCFMAASTLRLFTKNAENFNNSHERVMEGYKSFFAVDFPIYNLKIGASVTPMLAIAYTRNEMLKNTLFRILWSANGSDVHRSLKEFLYNQHLKNTGMHIVKLFSDCTEALHVTPLDLINSMASARYDSILFDLVELLNSFLTSDSDNIQRRMWSYARIFDQTFFSSLQTKNCIDIVAILAYVLRRKNAKDSEGIFNIVHLNRLSEEERAIARHAANKLIASVTSS